jgi:hypothetical protein
MDWVWVYVRTGTMVVDINDLPVVHEYSSIGALVDMVCLTREWPEYCVVQSVAVVDYEGC